MRSVLDFLKVGEDRLGALSVAAGGIEGLVVDCRHLIGYSTGLGVGSSQIGYDVTHAVLAGVVQNVELTVAGMLGSERVSLHPAFVDMLIEVFRRRGSRVDVAWIQAFEVLLCAQAH